MAHRIQHVAGFRRAISDVEVIPGENQADCFAGAFLDYLATFRLIDVVTDENGSTGDDMIDLFSSLLILQSVESEGRDHGTLDQRVRAFFVGYNSDDSFSAFECDRFVTDVSIIPPSQDNPPAAPTTAPAPTTTVAAALSPAPTATQQPTGLGTDPALDQLALECFGGSMDACDRLYGQAADGSPYKIYGDTCAGRQPEGTGQLCVDVFAPTTPVATPTTMAATSTTAAPTTAPPATQVTDLASLVERCATQVGDQFASIDPADITPASLGVVAELAAAEGKTLPQYIRDAIFSLSDGTEWGIFEPWEPATTAAEPSSELGWIQGLALSCAFDATAIPTEVRERYLNNASGSESWDHWTMRWGAEQVEGTELFMIYFGTIA
jgi:hypothetical protein